MSLTAPDFTAAPDLPALESAHALHHAGRLANELGHDGRILVCLSGRGDKDMDVLAEFDATD